MHIQDHVVTLSTTEPGQPDINKNPANQQATDCCCQEFVSSAAHTYDNDSENVSRVQSVSQDISESNDCEDCHQPEGIYDIVGQHHHDKRHDDRHDHQ